MMNSSLLPCTVQVLKRIQCEGGAGIACIVRNVQQGLNLLRLQPAVECNLRKQKVLQRIERSPRRTKVFSKSGSLRAFTLIVLEVIDLGAATARRVVLDPNVVDAALVVACRL